MSNISKKGDHCLVIPFDRRVVASRKSVEASCYATELFLRPAVPFSYEIMRLLNICVVILSFSCLVFDVHIDSDSN